MPPVYCNRERSLYHESNTNSKYLIVITPDVPDGIGSKTNTLAAAGLKTNQGNNESSASAILTVNDESVIVKSYLPSTVE
jgi:hypothetical protein